MPEERTRSTPGSSLFPAHIEGFTEPDEIRFSCIVWPSTAEHGGWVWMVYQGDGSTPGDVQRGSSASTMAEALEAAARFVHEWHPEMDRV